MRNLQEQLKKHSVSKIVLTSDYLNKSKISKILQTFVLITIFLRVGQNNFRKQNTNLRK